MKQTVVEWFNEQIKLNSEFRENLKGCVSFSIGLSKIDELFNQAKEMEKEQSHKYAEFAIRCDRMDMKILNFEDFIKLETFKSE